MSWPPVAAINQGAALMQRDAARPRQAGPVPSASPRRYADGAREEIACLATGGDLIH